MRSDRDALRSRSSFGFSRSVTAALRWRGSCPYSRVRVSGGLALPVLQLSRSVTAALRWRGSCPVVRRPQAVTIGALRRGFLPSPSGRQPKWSSLRLCGSPPWRLSRCARRRLLCCAFLLGLSVGFYCAFPRARFVRAFSALVPIPSWLCFPASWLSGGDPGRSCPLLPATAGRGVLGGRTAVQAVAAPLTLPLLPCSQGVGRLLCLPPPSPVSGEGYGVGSPLRASGAFWAVALPVAVVIIDRRECLG